MTKDQPQEDYLQGSGMTSPRARERLIEKLRDQGIKDPGVLQVIKDVPRHIFVDEALASRAYENTALPISHGQTISQPYIVARMTEALFRTDPMKTVLEVGTGSGYQAAILAKLARRVYTTERIQALCDLARQRFRLLNIRNIHCKYADGSIGLESHAPFDGIMVTAAPEGIPLALVNQLRIGGSMIIPIGARDEQILIRIIKTEAGYEKEFLERVVFVPLLSGIYA